MSGPGMDVSGIMKFVVSGCALILMIWQITHTSRYSQETIQFYDSEDAYIIYRLRGLSKHVTSLRHDALRNNAAHRDLPSFSKQSDDVFELLADFGREVRAAGTAASLPACGRWLWTVGRSILARCRHVC